MLTVGGTTYALEAVTLHNALETTTLGSTDNVHVLGVCEHLCGEDVTELELLVESDLELNHLLLRSGSCLCKMPLERRAGLLLFLFVIGKLYGGVTVFLNRTDLRDNTRTSLNNSAWDILPLGTENGSHSDFLSN